MNARNPIPLMVVAMVIVLLAGCAVPQETSPTGQPTKASTPTVQPIETSTPTVQPSETPTPTVQTTEIPTFNAGFNGNECVAAVPTQLPLGEYSFAFTNNSDIEVELWLVYLENGKTFQDLLDLQSEPGEWDPKPSWAYYADRRSTKTLESDGGKVILSTWDLDVTAEYIILCYVPSPQMIYYAGPVMVVKSSSD